MKGLNTDWSLYCEAEKNRLIQTDGFFQLMNRDTLF